MSSNNQDDLENENFDEPVRKFHLIANMENIKRAFFNNDYNLSEELMKEHPFKFYNVSYRYSSEKDAAPEFIAKNLLKGFVRNMDDYRKYFMICFRCYSLENSTYDYPSLWIVNSEDNISDIIGSIYEDFIFTEVDRNEEDNINNFLLNFRKKDFDIEINLLDEKYIH
jgi:hypothetical protein